MNFIIILFLIISFDSSGINATTQLNNPVFWVKVYKTEKIMTPSNVGLNHLQNNDLEIELSCHKTDVIQGESIDILVKIKNNTDKTLRTGKSKHYLYDSSKDSIFANRDERPIVDIPPFGSYYYFVDPVDWVVFSGIDFSTHSLYPGDYEYYLSWFVGRDEFTSNKIYIKVNPVPDSLQQAFNDFRYDPNKNYPEVYETLAEKYRGTFYEQKFYYQLLSVPNYSINLKSEFYKEFIIKYCNTGNAYWKFRGIINDYTNNKTLVEDIITSLKKDKPDNKLLEVLRNQPEYINKQIKHLLD